MKFCVLVLLLFCVVSVSAIDYSDVKTEYGDVEVFMRFGLLDEQGKDAKDYLNALQIVNVDNDNRIVGLITMRLEFKGAVNEWSDTLKNISYSYVKGHRLKYGDGSNWNAVLYCMMAEEDDNEIYYGYAPALMDWKHAGYDLCGSCSIYRDSPFVVSKMTVKYSSGTQTPVSIFSHQKKPDSKNDFRANDWIANHGTYRLYDTSRFDKAGPSKNGEEIMHLLYYPLVQHMGSYFT